MASVSVPDTGHYNETQGGYLLRFAGWPEELVADALSVMWCESSGNPSMIGDNGNSIGLFQIQWTPTTWNGWKYARGMESLKYKDIRDPLINSRAALVIYKNYGGWYNWSCKP